MFAAPPGSVLYGGPTDIISCAPVPGAVLRVTPLREPWLEHHRHSGPRCRLSGGSHAYRRGQRGRGRTECALACKAIHDEHSRGREGRSLARFHDPIVIRVTILSDTTRMAIAAIQEPARARDPLHRRLQVNGASARIASAKAAPMPLPMSMRIASLIEVPSGRRTSSARVSTGDGGRTTAQPRNGPAPMPRRPAGPESPWLSISTSPATACSIASLPPRSARRPIATTKIDSPERRASGRCRPITSPGAPPAHPVFRKSARRGEFRRTPRRYP